METVHEKIYMVPIYTCYLNMSGWANTNTTKFSIVRRLIVCRASVYANYSLGNWLECFLAAVPT